MYVDKIVPPHGLESPMVVTQAGAVGIQQVVKMQSLASCTDGVFASRWRCERHRQKDDQARAIAEVDFSRDIQPGR